MCGIFFSLCRSRSVSPDPGTARLLGNRGPDSFGTHQVRVYADHDVAYEATFVSTVLSLRGTAITEQPVVDEASRSVLCWNGEAWKFAGRPVTGSDSQLVDFTTMVDTAAFTAAVATDPNPTPRYLRIASDVVSPRDIANVESEVYGAKYQPSYMGPIWVIERMIPVMRLFGGEDKVMNAWQGMQYMTNMYSGLARAKKLDNDRYPEIKWTKLVDFIRADKEKEQTA